MIIMLNQHLSKPVKTKTAHYNLHEGGIHGRTLVFFSQVCLINWPQSVDPTNAFQYGGTFKLWLTLSRC